MRVASFVGRRLLEMIPVIGLVAVAIFALMRLLPRDPALALLGNHATPHAVAELRQETGLDHPLAWQFWLYLRGLVTGQLGRSVTMSVPVAQLVVDRTPVTLMLTGMAALIAVVIVTHDLGVVAGTCDRVAVMYAGRIMEVGPIDTVFDAAAHAYTPGLIRSVPDGRHARETLSSIPGNPPEPGRLRPGCRFHPRCGFGTEACTQRPPPLVPLRPGHLSACIHTDRVQAEAVAG